MNEIIKRLANAIEYEMNEKNAEWFAATYTIVASSSINVAYDLKLEVFNKDNKTIDSEMIWIDNSDSYKKELFLVINRENKINKAVFSFKNKQFFKCQLEWDQTIQDEFEQYLPKSKKGKINAWYLPDENVEKEAEILKQLPKSFVKFDTTNLDYEKAFNELNKTVTYPEDPLWDGGFYAIRKQENTWTGESCLYLFDAEEENPRNFQAEKVDFDLNITDEMKVLFNFIQQFYAEYNPNEPYDAMFVTVQPNQSYVVNYEYGGEEVFPNAPPKPDEINADYILQNLYNCLVYNTPENFEWAWAIISRGKNSEGHPVKSGSYFYSLQPDKSNPQKLIPGEYEFMINVTIRLFEEFIEKENHNWTKVQILFSKNNEKNYCQILE